MSTFCSRSISSVSTEQWRSGAATKVCLGRSSLRTRMRHQRSHQSSQSTKLTICEAQYGETRCVNKLKKHKKKTLQGKSKLAQVCDEAPFTNSGANWATPCDHDGNLAGTDGLLQIRVLSQHSMVVEALRSELIHWRKMDQPLVSSSAWVWNDLLQKHSMECTEPMYVGSGTLSMERPVALINSRAQSSSSSSNIKDDETMPIDQRRWQHIPSMDRVLSQCLPFSYG